MRRAPNLLLRLGVAFAFLYPAVDAVFVPDNWIGYFPHTLRMAAHAWGVPDLMLLHSFGALEVVLALWILSGKRIFLPAAAATAILCTIIVFDFNQFEVVFRDVAIAAAAAALALSAW